MRRLPSFCLLSLFLGFFLFTSCETIRKRESDNPAREAQRLTEEAAVASGKMKVSTRQIAVINPTGPPTFKTSQSVLATAFIRQFGDGTVIDKVLVRKAPGGPADVPHYFLIGLGQRDGSYRAMAVPLRIADDGTLYLSSESERYVATGIGCPTCFFDFEGSHIIGSSCDDNSGGSRCAFKMLNENTLFVQK
jgi:hypothetical protein